MTSISITVSLPDALAKLVDNPEVRREVETAAGPLVEALFRRALEKASAQNDPSLRDLRARLHAVGDPPMTTQDLNEVISSVRAARAQRGAPKPGEEQESTKHRGRY